MASYSTTPLIGIDLGRVDTDPAFKTGTVVDAADGKRYVYGVAGADISANDADCAIDATTFAVTASGGAYKAPAVAVATGKYAWFGKAGV